MSTSLSSLLRLIARIGHLGPRKLQPQVLHQPGLLKEGHLLLQSPRSSLSSPRHQNPQAGFQQHLQLHKNQQPRLGLQQHQDLQLQLRQLQHRQQRR